MPPQRPAANDGGDPNAGLLDAGISALSIDPSADSPHLASWLANDLLGNYRLLERIGWGGMGEVWLAEQTQPVRRNVAVKLIKAGMDTGEVLRRFQSERQALALMDHPGIAKVFEAGSTPRGRPYFVMEYITGVPITQYCDECKMPVRQRLELFVQVCDAVQHAHQKAIIHRDLKPSNILVSEVDGKPTARVIDFGVAKAISNSLPAEAQFTRTGAVVGTPPYMSPEQAGSLGIDSMGLDVDTRSDVYSLGVVLYELLVGRRPLEFHNLAVDQVLRRLREEEAPSPSTRLRALKDTSAVTAENRASDPPSLLRQLRGDLDAIALKALEKDRSRRYGSPSDLAADIGRYLRHEPVLAVAPSVVYRSRKFARRYRGALATATAFVLVLIVAAAVSIRQSVRARSEAAVAEAIDDFLRNDLLAQASTYTQWGLLGKTDPDLKVRSALDRAAARITGKFDRQPAVEAAIRHTIGQTYMSLGLSGQAQAQLERTLQLDRRSLGEEDPSTLRDRAMLASLAGAQSKYAEAAQLFSQVLAMQRRILGPKHPDTLKSAYDLALFYREQGKYPEAEALVSQVLQISREVFGPEEGRTLSCMDRLAEVYYREGKYPQAEALGRQVLTIRRRAMGAEDPETTVSMSDLANVYAAQGQFALAEGMYAQVLDIRRRVLGPEFPYTMAAMNNLAVSYHADGKYAQSEALNRQALEIRRRVQGPQSPETLMSMENLACDYTDEKRYAEAEALFGETLKIQLNVMGMESRHTLSTLADAAALYQKEGKYALAESYAAKVLAAWRRALGPQSAVTMTAANDLALADLSQGKFAASEALARESVEFYRKNQPDDWQCFRAESLLGASLAGQRKFAEAAPLLKEGFAGMLARKERMTVCDRYHLERAREWTLRLQQAPGQLAPGRGRGV